MVNLIRKLMQEQNIKQVDFANKLGITTVNLAKYISKKESNRRDIPNSILSKMALLLKVDIDYLLGVQDERVVTPKDFSIKIPYLRGLEAFPMIFSIDKVRDFISVDISFYSDNMYAIKITSTEMYPQIEKNDTCLCVYDGDQPIKENMIVHYSFKEKNGIRVIKIDEETNQISLVPLNLEKHKIITIPSKELHLLKTAKIIRLIRDL